jgi:hypothetical protein
MFPEPDALQALRQEVAGRAGVQPHGAPCPLLGICMAKNPSLFPLVLPRLRQPVHTTTKHLTQCSARPLSSVKAG